MGIAADAERVQLAPRVRCVPSAPHRQPTRMAHTWARMGHAHARPVRPRSGRLEELCGAPLASKLAEPVPRTSNTARTWPGSRRRWRDQRGRICRRQTEQVVHRVPRRGGRRGGRWGRRACACHVPVGVWRRGRQADEVSRAARGRQVRGARARQPYARTGRAGRRTAVLVSLQPGRPRLRLICVLPLCRHATPLKTVCSPSALLVSTLTKRQ